MPLLRGNSLWNVAIDLERAYAAKKGATSDEWDLLSVAKMAGIRDQIRVDDIEPLWQLLDELGLEDEFVDKLRDRYSTQREEQADAVKVL